MACATRNARVKMGKFSGKKLLVLGSNVGATDIVTYARKNGAYVVVADWNPEEESPAKQVADEGILVSTADVEALCEYVKLNAVDGVLAGISEFNLLKAMEVSERCNLPFYCRKEQWDQVESKDRFRKLCEKCGVPCPKTYYAGDPDGIVLEDIAYPAVLKPVDGSASQGVRICASQKDLVESIDASAAASRTGAIIVEEFVAGDEFTAHYVIHGGKAKLVCIDNRIPVAVHEGAVTTIPVARTYPNEYIDAYIEAIDAKMIALCESIDLDEAVLFIQGLHNRTTGRFVIFEAGLRGAGEAPNRFIREINGPDYMTLLVDKALSVSSNYDLTKEDPKLGGKYCGVVSFVAKGGIVGSITGLEETVAQVKSVIEYESRYPVGSMTPNGDTLRQLMIRFVMICENKEQMAADIARLNENISVKDANGDELVVKMEPRWLFQL